MRTKCYMVRIEPVMMLLKQAGFKDVKRIDDQYFQPIVCGTQV